jgi:hypothetical protein
MVGVIKFFGVISIVVAVILFVLSIGTIVLLPTLLPLGASALLGGALLIAFARVVELLESIDKKIDPVHRIAHELHRKYEASPTATAAESMAAAAKASSSFPKGTTLYDANGIRVAMLPDQSLVVFQGGRQVKFETATDYREKTRDMSHWTVLEQY